MPERISLPCAGPVHPAATVLDADSVALIEGAIAPATRANYTFIWQRFRNFCGAHVPSLPTEPFGLIATIAFLTHIANQREPYLAYRSIRVYRSALSTLWSEGPFSSYPNPTEDSRVTRLMQGIQRLKLDDDERRRERRSEKTVEINFDLLLMIEATLCTSRQSPSRIMKWAALTAGVHALLRLNELLGSRLHPERILLAKQITFHKDGRGIAHINIVPTALPTPPDQWPDYYRIRLGSTKADPLRKNEPVHVLERPAVQAMWRWMQWRASYPAGMPPELFCLPDESPLTLAGVTSFVQDWFSDHGRGRPVITGKAFRRGGASSLLAAGLPRADVAERGRWRSVDMVDTYASREAKRTRAIAAGRQS